MNVPLLLYSSVETIRFNASSSPPEHFMHSFVLQMSCAKLHWQNRGGRIESIISSLNLQSLEVCIIEAWKLQSLEVSTYFLEVSTYIEVWKLQSLEVYFFLKGNVLLKLRDTGQCRVGEDADLLKEILASEACLLNVIQVWKL